MSAVLQLLSRLQGVRQSGKGWTAKCPAHQDRLPSLSIAVGDDGRVLLHCHGGCGVADVVAAVGLEVGDLFLRRSKDYTEEGRTQARAAFRQSAWTSAIGVLQLESKVCQIAARDVLTGKPLVAEDVDRLIIACCRIDDAAEVICGGT